MSTATVRVNLKRKIPWYTTKYCDTNRPVLMSMLITLLTYHNFWPIFTRYFSTINLSFSTTYTQEYLINRIKVLCNVRALDFRVRWHENRFIINYIKLHITGWTQGSKGKISGISSPSKEALKTQSQPLHTSQPLSRMTA